MFCSSRQYKSIIFTIRYLKKQQIFLAAIKAFVYLDTEFESFVLLSVFHSVMENEPRGAVNYISTVILLLYIRLSMPLHSYLALTVKNSVTRTRIRQENILISLADIFSSFNLYSQTRFCIVLSNVHEPLYN